MSHRGNVSSPRPATGGFKEGTLKIGGGKCRYRKIVGECKNLKNNVRPSKTGLCMNDTREKAQKGIQEEKRQRDNCGKSPPHESLIYRGIRLLPEANLPKGTKKGGKKARGERRKGKWSE